MKQIPVLYIGGDGRSGSTILEKTLQQHPKLVGIGEAKALWVKGYLTNTRCSCGQPFRQCRFWSQVLDNGLDNLTPLKVKFFMKIQQHLPTIRELFPWLKKFWDPHELRSQQKTLGRSLESLYREILQVANANVIIESSKNLARALFLEQHPQFEVFALHLIRDPRGVTYSFKHRPKKLPEYRDRNVRFVTKPIWKKSIRWLQKNFLWELSRFRFTNYQRLYYEDFVENPSDQLKSLFQWINQTPIEFSKITTSENEWHSVAGNPIRFEQGEIKISSDTAWKKKMPFYEKFTASVLTLPLMLRYGYFP